MAGVSLQDRAASVLAYYTCGIFSIVLIVYAKLTKKQMTPFVVFNVYQAIFLSVVLFGISIIYQIALNILIVIPFIGKLANIFNVFINATPIYFGFTISGFITTLLLTYLAVYSLMGKRPYVPYISDILNNNFGG